MTHVTDEQIAQEIAALDDLLGTPEEADAIFEDRYSDTMYERILGSGRCDPSAAWSIAMRERELLSALRDERRQTARLREALEQIAYQKYPADDPELHTEEMRDPYVVLPVQFARTCWLWDTARRALNVEDVTTDD
jgi:hypothetical protein